MERFAVSNFDDVLDILGARLYADFEPELIFPEYQKRVNGTVQGDCPFAGKSMIFHDERTFEDPWGVIRRIGRDGKYLEWVSGPLVEKDMLEHYSFPGAENIPPLSELSSKIQSAKGKGLYTRVFVPNPYKSAWYMRGMENLLMDYMLDPEYVNELYTRISGFWNKVLTRFVQAGIDMIAIEGDIAMQDRIIMGADRWREHDKPVLKKMIMSCRKINPGITTFFHSDGDIMPVMTDLIETGFQVIDSLQPECIDPYEVKQKFGGQIVLHGCGSLQHTLPLGTPDDCRREVKQLIEGCGKNGGLVLRPSNMIGFDVPLENITAWFETARDYRL
jgi:uroporphyrinogen decarboxylase